MLQKRLWGTVCALALVAGLSTLASTAVAGNPHGTPPGQARADADVAASADVNADASVAASEHSSAQAKTHGQVKEKATTHVSSSTTVGAGAGVRSGTSSSARANAPGHVKQKATTHVSSTTTVGAGVSVQAGQSSSAHASARGQLKKAAAANTSSATAANVSANTNAGVQGAAKFAGCTASPSQGAGVKPNSTTLKWTCAAATSNQTKLYGNGQTAGGIAVSRGGAGAMLFGPGNSQPHKVQACVKGKIHLVDVHAVKSYSVGSCGQPSVTGSTTTFGNVSVSTSTLPTVTTTLTTAANVSTSPTVTTAATVSASASTPTVTTSTAAAANNAATGTPISSAGGVKGTTHTSGNANANAGTAPGQGGVLGASTQKLPFTGLPLWLVALAGLGALGTGLMLRRVGRSHAH